MIRLFKLIVGFIFAVSLSAQAQISIDDNWPASPDMPIQESFKVLRRLIEEDPFTRNVLEEANSLLKQGRIQDISEILSYCPLTDGDSVGGKFSQKQSIISTRYVIDAVVLSDWRESDKEQLRTAFRSKILSIPFLEMAMVTGSPSICIRKNMTVASAVGTLIHEIIHFTRRIPFAEIEYTVKSDKIEDLLHKNVMKPGGEYEAYYYGMAAEKRLRARKVSRANQVPVGLHYFDSQGRLIDKVGFEKFVKDLYIDFRSPEYKRLHIQERIAWHSQIRSIFKNNLRNILTYRGEFPWVERLDLEISHIERLIQKLENELTK